MGKTLLRGILRHRKPRRARQCQRFCSCCGDGRTKPFLRPKSQRKTPSGSARAPKVKLPQNRLKSTNRLGYRSGRGHLKQVFVNVTRLSKDVLRVLSEKGSICVCRVSTEGVCNLSPTGHSRGNPCLVTSRRLRSTPIQPIVRQNIMDRLRELNADWRNTACPLSVNSKDDTIQEPELSMKTLFLENLSICKKMPIDESTKENVKMSQIENQANVVSSQDQLLKTGAMESSHSKARILRTPAALKSMLSNSKFPGHMGKQMFVPEVNNISSYFPFHSLLGKPSSGETGPSGNPSHTDSAKKHGGQMFRSLLPKPGQSLKRTSVATVSGVHRTPQETPLASRCLKITPVGSSNNNGSDDDVQIIETPSISPPTQKPSQKPVHKSHDDSGSKNGASSSAFKNPRGSRRKQSLVPGAGCDSSKMYQSRYVISKTSEINLSQPPPTLTNTTAHSPCSKDSPESMVNSTKMRSIRSNPENPDCPPLKKPKGNDFHTIVLSDSSEDEPIEKPSKETPSTKRKFRTNTNQSKSTTIRRSIRKKPCKQEVSKSGSVKRKSVVSNGPKSQNTPRTPMENSLPKRKYNSQNMNARNVRSRKVSDSESEELSSDSEVESPRYVSRTGRSSYSSGCRSCPGCKIDTRKEKAKPKLARKKREPPPKFLAPNYAASENKFFVGNMHAKEAKSAPIVVIHGLTSSDSSDEELSGMLKKAKMVIEDFRVRDCNDSPVVDGISEDLARTSDCNSEGSAACGDHGRTIAESKTNCERPDLVGSVSETHCASPDDRSILHSKIDESACSSTKVQCFFGYRDSDGRLLLNEIESEPSEDEKEPRDSLLARNSSESSCTVENFDSNEYTESESVCSSQSSSMPRDPSRVVDVQKETHVHGSENCSVNDVSVGDGQLSPRPEGDYLVSERLSEVSEVFPSKPESDHTDVASVSTQECKAVASSTTLSENLVPEHGLVPLAGETETGNESVDLHAIRDSFSVELDPGVTSAVLVPQREFTSTLFPSEGEDPVDRDGADTVLFQDIPQGSDASLDSSAAQRVPCKGDHPALDVDAKLLDVLTDQTTTQAQSVLYIVPTVPTHDLQSILELDQSLQYNAVDRTVGVEACQTGDRGGQDGSLEQMKSDASPPEDQPACSTEIPTVPTHDPQYISELDESLQSDGTESTVEVEACQVGDPCGQGGLLLLMTADTSVPEDQLACEIEMQTEIPAVPTNDPQSISELDQSLQYDATESTVGFEACQMGDPGGQDGSLQQMTSDPSAPEDQPACAIETQKEIPAVPTYDPQSILELDQSLQNDAAESTIGFEACQIDDPSGQDGSLQQMASDTSSPEDRPACDVEMGVNHSCKPESCTTSPKELKLLPDSQNESVHNPGASLQNDTSQKHAVGEHFDGSNRHLEIHVLDGCPSCKGVTNGTPKDSLPPENRCSQEGQVSNGDQSLPGVLPENCGTVSQEGNFYYHISNLMVDCLNNLVESVKLDNRDVIIRKVNPGSPKNAVDVDADYQEANLSAEDATIMRELNLPCLNPRLTIKKLPCVPSKGNSESEVNAASEDSSQESGSDSCVDTPKDHQVPVNSCPTSHTTPTRSLYDRKGYPTPIKRLNPRVLSVIKYDDLDIYSDEPCLNDLPESDRVECVSSKGVRIELNPEELSNIEAFLNQKYSGNGDIQSTDVTAVTPREVEELVIYNDETPLTQTPSRSLKSALVIESEDLEDLVIDNDAPPLNEVADPGDPPRTEDVPSSNDPDCMVISSDDEVEVTSEPPMDASHLEVTSAAVTTVAGELAAGSKKKRFKRRGKPVNPLDAPSIVDLQESQMALRGQNPNHCVESRRRPQVLDLSELDPSCNVIEEVIIDDTEPVFQPSWEPLPSLQSCREVLHQPQVFSHQGHPLLGRDAFGRISASAAACSSWGSARPNVVPPSSQVTFDLSETFAHSPEPESWTISGSDTLTGSESEEDVIVVSPPKTSHVNRFISTYINGCDSGSAVVQSVDTDSDDDVIMISDVPPANNRLPNPPRAVIPPSVKRANLHARNGKIVALQQNRPILSNPSPLAAQLRPIRAPNGESYYVLVVPPNNCQVNRFR